MSEETNFAYEEFETKLRHLFAETLGTRTRFLEGEYTQLAKRIEQGLHAFDTQILLEQYCEDILEDEPALSPKPDPVEVAVTVTYPKCYAQAVFHITVERSVAESDDMMLEIIDDKAESGELEFDWQPQQEWEAGWEIIAQGCVEDLV